MDGIARGAAVHARVKVAAGGGHRHLFGNEPPQRRGDRRAPTPIPSTAGRRRRRSPRARSSPAPPWQGRGARAEIDPQFIDALADVAENDGLEAAFRAQVLQLPGEADIAREIGRDVDPDAIASARNAIRAAIADRAGSRLAALVDRLKGAGPFSPRRRLGRPARAPPTPPSTLWWRTATPRRPPASSSATAAPTT
ncbi:MAG: aminopeptidase N C-terminal domain-containing protein [Bauldia sp.]